MDVPLEFGDSRLNSYRDIRAAHVVMDEERTSVCEVLFNGASTAKGH